MGGEFRTVRGGTPRRGALRPAIPGLRLEQSVALDGAARRGLRVLRPLQRLYRPFASLAQFGHIQISPIVTVPKVISPFSFFFFLF